ITCANETIYVAGNITISNNGSLTLYNVTINFSAFADGSNFINKSPNGGLFIYDLDSNASTIEDATEIISNNSDYEFDFWVYGNGVSDNFTMQNSIVKDAGYSTKSLGIQLYNVSNVKVIGNNISDGAYYGLYLQYSTNNNISNNIINTTANNGYGIYLSSSSNSTIQSNTITTNGSWSYGILIDASSNSNTLQSNTITTSNTNGYGIYLFSNSNSNTIQSNTITTNGSFGYGIYLLSSSNSNTLQSNTITTNGSSSYGIFLSTTLNNISSNAIITNNATSIYLSGSSNNNLTSNRINATGTIADGIYVFASSDNNIINLNNITKAGRDGIRFENSGTALPERNNITNNIILNATGSGIFLNNTLTASQLIYNNNISYSSNNSILLNNASNITIISGSLEYSRTGINATSSRNVTIANATFVLNTLWDFYVTTNSWITSLNNTFNKSAVNITGAAGDFSNFTVMWYARANVTNSSGSAMNAASVTSTDVYSGTEWTDTTTNGLTGWFAVIDYVQTATSTNSFNMHTGAASLTGYLPNSTTYNVSIKNITGTQVDVVLKDARKFCNGNYTEGQATWNITSNVTCANQTIYVAGNITIFNNGSLTLYNVTINFSMFADGSNFINKSPNGGLYIYDSDSNASTQEDATEIISNNGNYEFDFWIYGNSLNDNFTMKNSIIKDAGYSFGSQGIQLFNVSNAIITGNNISEGSYYGLYMQYSQNNNISGNTIITNGSFGYGIYLVSSSNSSITGNTITTAGSNGIWLSSSSNSTISNNAIIANGKLSFSPMLDINYSQSINTTGYECYRTTHKANFSANQVRVAFAAGNGSFTPLAASVAKAINATAIYLNTRRQLFFGSLPYRSIPSNQFDASDWTNLSIQQGENLTIQFLVPDNGGGDLSITNGSSFKYAAGPGAASDATYYTTNSNLTFCNATNIAEWNSSVYFSSSASSYIYGIAWIEFRNTTDTSDGIYIFSDSDNNRIDRNNITKAGRDGIRIEVSESFVPERNNITNNVILNATQNGILINQTGTASQLMQNNNITYSGINYAAVKLINASNITIIGGFMQNNTVGINASQSINITVANVTFTGSALWDFYITNNSWLISLNNSFNKSAVNVTGRSSSTTTYNYSNFQQYWNDSNSTGTALYSAGLFDYDGDGSLNDIVFGGIGRLSAFYQNGTPLWNWTGGNSTNDYVYDIEIINNRTIAAILNTGATNGSLIILDRNSNLICNTSDLGTAYAAAAGDFNQDGNKSEIVVGESGDIFAFYSNCTQIWTDSSPVGNAGDVETGDLNNDGYYDDIAVADAGSGPTDGGILVYNGSGDFQWNVSGTASLSVEIGDIDGNGVDDIVAQSFTNYELLAYNGSGYNLWNFTDPTYDIYEIRFGNFSNKGIIAFVANNIITSSTLYVLNASGNQSWNASLPSLDTQGWFSLAVGDLDNDGLDDIVVGSDDATPFQVLMFNNSGSNLWNYTTGNDIGSIYADGALEIADIDGDGKKDVIAASQDNYGYVLYANRTVSAIISNDYSNFTNQYYVDVNVTWSNSSAVSGATVLAYENSTSSWVQRWTDTTASNGFTGKWAVIEYVQNATNIVNYTSNFTANYSDQANSTLKYITSSQQVDVRLNSTAAAPPSNATFNITFLITKALAPDMVMAASNETINVTTTVKVNRTTNSISFINITDEIPYDFIYENESRIAVLFINWSDAGSNTIDITANATKTIVKNGGTANTWLIINISNMSTSLGYYMTENDSIQINYLMNSSKMNANDTRLIYTNVTVKDIASNTAADFKLTNITSSQIVLRGYKKISVDPANPQNATVGIEMTSLGGKLTGILMADYLPNAISGKSGLIGLNITYYNKTSNSYKTLTEPEDYKLYNPYNSTLPDNQAASVFSYNFSYNFTNWDGTLYENDSLLINYSVVIAGGGSWTLPAIIGGWDPQYQKHIKTQMYTQVSVPSFDVITKVLTPKIKPGENVKALLQMLNVGGPKAKVDVFVTYSMKTMIGELITERSETLAVVEQKEKELILATPSTVKPGMYTFETFVTYTGREAVSTDVFEVLGEKGSGFNAQWLMFGMFGLVMVLAIIFAIIRVRKW
ncbi:right-handed parallel beta-helix repeat-containing protein, partial [Candidatus Woesearchaeota archaeon]|nr:right-handed parallel beta-helix repeat-containing protein [Candidatus Woesearchaeota archaeon]